MQRIGSRSCLCFSCGTSLRGISVDLKRRSRSSIGLNSSSICRNSNLGNYTRSVSLIPNNPKRAASQDFTDRLWTSDQANVGGKASISQNLRIGFLSMCNKRSIHWNNVTDWIEAAMRSELARRTHILMCLDPKFEG